MKYLIFILSVLFGASPLFAQQPSISYLMCDEAKSQLQIHGSFGKDSGSVSIEDTTLGIVSWSDSLIICNLPDKGKGAGGSVKVENSIGKSNVRILSIVNLKIDDFLWQHQSNTIWAAIANWTWYCHWRVDLLKDKENRHAFFSFELSKLSVGSALDADYFNFGQTFFWTDTTALKDSTISVSGKVNLDKHEFVLESIFMGKTKYTKGLRLPSQLIRFDSLGFMESVIDTIPNGGSSGSEHYIITYSEGSISFPPSVKSNIPLYPEINDHIYVRQEDHSLILHSENLLGSTTASIFTIDGRLLKRTKFDVVAPGDYSIDVSEVHTHFAILVLQTAKGVITKKIIF